MEALAPMPRASVRMATAARPGDFASDRALQTKSRQSHLIQDFRFAHLGKRSINLLARRRTHSCAPDAGRSGHWRRALRMGSSRAVLWRRWPDYASVFPQKWTELYPSHVL